MSAREKNPDELRRVPPAAKNNRSSTQSRLRFKDRYPVYSSSSWFLEVEGEVEVELKERKKASKKMLLEARMSQSASTSSR